MSKVALLIGVTDYQAGLTPLPGAERDVQALHQVLKAPEIGGFDQITPLINPEPQEMQEEIEALFRDRDRDDLVLLFFSGHGIKDDSGRLYFATRKTRKTPRGELVKSTAVPASFVHEIMGNSRSKRQVIVLDCCFSGAFAEDMRAKDDGRVDVQKQLGGEGRAVLTSSTSTQYSFEQATADLSVYTRYLIEGIETGAADQDNDGAIAVDELHEYAKKRVQETAPAMKPEIFTSKEGFRIKLAQAMVGDPKVRYRREVARFTERGEISEIARLALEARRQGLGLSREEATAIESEVLLPSRTYRSNLRQYEQKLLEAVIHEFPLSEATRNDLNYLKLALALRDEDVEPIEARIEARQHEFGQLFATANPGVSNWPVPSAPETIPVVETNTPKLIRQPTPKATTPSQKSPPQSLYAPAYSVRKKGQMLWGLLAASLLLIASSAGVYIYRQFSWSDKLNQATELANQDRHEEAVILLEQIPDDSSYGDKAKKHREAWSKQLMDRAQERYDAGRLEEAKELAEAVPLSSSLYDEAQAAIAKWEAAWNRDQALLAEINDVLSSHWDIEGAKARMSQLSHPKLKQDAQAAIAEYADKVTKDQQEKLRQEQILREQAERRRIEAERQRAEAERRRQEAEWQRIESERRQAEEAQRQEQRRREQEKQPNQNQTAPSPEILSNQQSNNPLMDLLSPR
ncbi:caspase, EACC1-associated type [Thermoleptolyngbya oregonensis]|uniref:caspase family protein n=1 Tax=Thermoleptolyngbya oregonensis TaxID=2303529 RepID=UPI00292E091C